MVAVKIRTSDKTWAERLGLAVEDESKGDGFALVTVHVPDVERLTFAGRAMVRFDLGADLPRDYPNRWVLTPASYAA